MGLIYFEGIILDCVDYILKELQNAMFLGFAHQFFDNERRLIKAKRARLGRVSLNVPAGNCRDISQGKII